MKAFIPNYEIIAPKNLSEALSALEGGQAKPIAGGTDLMVLLESGKLPEGKFVSIWNLPELKGIRVESDFVEIGALTTFTEIRESEILHAEFPLLCQAAQETGALAIQNRGTIGGNIANASPAADTPPALLVYDCEINLASSKGKRTVSYQKFHLGYKKLDMASGELITSVKLKRNTRGARQFYRKVGTRQAQAISKVCLAAAKFGEEYRISFGSVAATPVRCFKTEATLKGQKLNSAVVDQAVKTLQQEIAPIDDIRSTKEYRLTVAQNILREFLESL